MKNIEVHHALLTYWRNMAVEFIGIIGALFIQKKKTPNNNNNK